MKTLVHLMIAITLVATAAKADPKATHGMLLFGDKVTYASHLPMFHFPHDYQVILKVGLTNGDVAVNPALKKYAFAKAQGQTLFTLEPELLDLTKVMSGEVSTFGAILYSGHFEKDGIALGKVNVKVEKTILGTKLVAAAPEANEYVLFGEQGEYYAAHKIAGKPNFDVILAISAPWYKQIGHCRAVECPSFPPKFVADSELPLTVTYGFGKQTSAKPTVGSQLGNLLGPMANVTKILYLEEGELVH